MLGECRMKRYWAFGILALAGLVAGCGSGGPDGGDGAEPPPRPEVRVEIALAELLNKPRSELAARADGGPVPVRAAGLGDRRPVPSAELSARGPTPAIPVGCGPSWSRAATPTIDAVGNRLASIAGESHGPSHNCGNNAGWSHLPNSIVSTVSNEGIWIP